MGWLGDSASCRKLQSDHADDALNSEWNGMPDITEVLSTFISEELQPIAEAIELSQTKLARQHRMSETDMWDATSFEARSNALLRGHSVDPSKEAAKRATHKKQNPNEYSEMQVMQAQIQALQALTAAQAKANNAHAAATAKGRKAKGKVKGNGGGKGKHSADAKGKGKGKAKGGKGKAKGKDGAIKE